MLSWLLIGVWLLPPLMALVVLPGSPLGLRPDPLLWPVVFLGLYARDRQAVAYVAVLGLVRDLLTLGPLLASPLIYAVVFRLVQQNRHKVFRQAAAVQVAVTAAACTLAFGLEALALVVAGGALLPADAAWFAVAIAVPTAVLAPLAFAGYRVTLHRAGAQPNALGDYAI